MIVKVLAENTSTREDLGFEHGLSLYLETLNHKILFDTGASGLFAENAQKMGVDLAEIDMAVISHGHYDHGGGLKTFLSINGKAKIYVHEKAFIKHYSNRPEGTKYIGLDETLLPNDRFVFCGNHAILDDELELFSGVLQERLVPSGNAELFQQSGDTLVPDDFAHEQNLIISNGKKTLLMAGCAHNGIVNIVDRFMAIRGCMPNFVIGGFHLYSHGTDETENPKVVDEIGRILLDTHAQYYTCHCTGIQAFERLRKIMGQKMGYLATGDQINISL